VDKVRKKLGAILRDLAREGSAFLRRQSLFGWLPFSSLVYEYPTEVDEDGVAIELPRDLFDVLDISQVAYVAYRFFTYPDVKVAYLIIARSTGPYFDAREDTTGESPPEPEKGTLHAIQYREQPDIDYVLVRAILIEGWLTTMTPVKRKGTSDKALFLIPRHIREEMGIEPGQHITTWYKIAKDNVLELVIPKLEADGPPPE